MIELINRYAAQQGDHFFNCVEDDLKGLSLNKEHAIVLSRTCSQDDTIDTKLLSVACKSAIKKISERREEKNKIEQEFQNIFIAQLVGCFCCPCLFPFWTCAGYDQFIEDSRNGNFFDGW